MHIRYALKDLATALLAGCWWSHVGIDSENSWDRYTFMWSQRNNTWFLIKGTWTVWGPLWKYNFHKSNHQIAMWGPINNACCNKYSPMNTRQLCSPYLTLSSRSTKNLRLTKGDFACWSRWNGPNWRATLFGKLAPYFFGHPPKQISHVSSIRGWYFFGDF